MLIPMTKADGVRSTPRTSTSKIKANLIANGEGRDRHHAETFRDLKTTIHSIWCMAEIAAEVATGTQTDERIEMTHFTVYRLTEMIRDLRTKYQEHDLGNHHVPRPHFEA
jgi:hypothetical protein